MASLEQVGEDECDPKGENYPLKMTADKTGAFNICNEDNSPVIIHTLSHDDDEFKKKRWHLYYTK